MDSGSTFPHMQGFKRGSKKDSGRAQWLRPVRRGTAGRRGRFAPPAAMRPRFQEKATRTNLHPVPKPSQVGGYKDTKARGRNLVKELGNMAP